MKFDINNKVTNQEPRQPMDTHMSVPQQTKIHPVTVNQAHTAGVVPLVQLAAVKYGNVSSVHAEDDNKAFQMSSSSEGSSNQYHASNREKVNQQKLEHNQSISRDKDDEAVKADSVCQDGTACQAGIGSQVRHAKIAKRAYEIYEQSGYVKGQCEKNWKQAESESSSRKQ